MYRIDYEMMIDALENDETIKLIGKIDTTTIRKNLYIMNFLLLKELFWKYISCFL